MSKEAQELRDMAQKLLEKADAMESKLELKPHEWFGQEGHFIDCDGLIENERMCDVKLFEHPCYGKLEPIQNHLKLMSILFRLKVALGDDTGEPDGGGNGCYLPIYCALYKKWDDECYNEYRHFGVYFTEENCKKVCEYMNENHKEGLV